IGTVLAVVAFRAAAGRASAPYLFPASPLGTKVVVAKSNIPARTRITAGDLTLTAVNPVPPESFTNMSAVVGKGARVDIPAGEPVTSNLIASAPDLVSSSDVTYLPIPQGYVAVGAALGVALVVYGIVASNREAGLESGVGARVTYRTLADVREQLRRRFEPTGAPVWVAGPNTNALARDLASADLQLRPYEFRMLQIGAGIALALLAFLRFNVSFAVPVAAVIGYVLPAFYLRNRRGHRLHQ